MPCSCRSAWRRVVAVVRGDGLRCNVADVPVWRPWVPGLDSRLGFSIVKLVKSSSIRGKPRLDGGLYLRRAGRGFCTLPHPCNEAAPPPLGARCRSQIGTYAPGPGSHSGKSTCDTCAHRRAVASLRRWQEQAVVRERPPNAPPGPSSSKTEPTRPERHRHHPLSRPYAGTETATKCQDRRGTISLD